MERPLQFEGSLIPADRKLLDDSQLLETFRLMRLSRIVDERAVSLHRQGRIAAYAPVRGQEAAVVGSALALDPGRDWIVPQYRELPAYIRHGLPLISFWLARIGVGAGSSIPANVRLFPIQIAIAAQIPHAVGLAWGLRLRGEDGVVLVYFGDGATSEGDFHEAANFAGVLKAPVVLFCQNNGWAISTPRRRQTAASSIANRGQGYGIHSTEIDGDDLFAVYRATMEAVERARTGEGPTLIEAITHRLGMHNTADEPKRYMDQKELQRWETRDPVERFQHQLMTLGILNDELVGQLDKDLRAAVDESWRQAQAIAARLDPIAAMFDNVYNSQPGRQLRQRAEAERWAKHA
jgi:pyruvate dehydrogenase E1 component alpha subunit